MLTLQRGITDKQHSLDDQLVLRQVNNNIMFGL